MKCFHVIRSYVCLVLFSGHIGWCSNMASLVGASSLPSQSSHCERIFVYIYGVFSHVLGTWLDALIWHPCHNSLMRCFFGAFKLGLSVSYCEKSILFSKGMLGYVICSSSAHAKVCSCLLLFVGTQFDALTCPNSKQHLSWSFPICPLESPAIREALYLPMAYLLMYLYVLLLLLSTHLLHVGLQKFVDLMTCHRFLDLIVQSSSWLELLGLPAWASLVQDALCYS